MIAATVASGMTARENHNHGVPTRLNKARYFARAGWRQCARRKGDGVSGRDGGRTVISRCVTMAAQCPAGTIVSAISAPGGARRQTHQDRVDIAPGLQAE